MRTIDVDPRTDPLWQKLIEQHPSDAFHSPGWMRVLSDTYGFEVNACVLLDNAGEPIAGIPFVRIADFKGERIVTLPFSDYCDPLVGEPGHWQQLTQPLLAENCSFTLRCLHNSLPLEDERFEVVNKAKWHGLDLRPDLDTLWHGLHDSARRAIRKAEKQGVVVHNARDVETLRAFFELHLGVRKYKYHLLAQPYIFFENIWRQFIEEQCGALLVAAYEDEIIGGVLYLEWKDGLYYKFNASAPTRLSVRPNDILIWEGIQYAKAKGCTHLDFGLSDWDQEGLLRYKRKFTTEEKTISFLRYSPNGGSTQRTQQGADFLPQLTQLFTDEAVPDHVTEKAGDVLYRFFV
jgi:CelD/BcsL family acetyltransferase involved in cellulose biosynthesis